MTLGGLFLRASRTTIDLLIIASCVGLGILIFRIIKGLWSHRTTRRMTRTLNKIGKIVGFTVEHLYFGMFATMSWNLCHKRNESFLGKPDHGIRLQFHLADFPEGLKGGIMVFPKTAKEVITQRFRSSFPNDLYDFVLSVIAALIPTLSKYNRRRLTFPAYGTTQAVSFGLPVQEGCNKDHYECPCLDIVGVSSEFLFLLASELLTIFDQSSAILKPEDLGGIWKIRRIMNRKLKVKN